LTSIEIQDLSASAFEDKDIFLMGSSMAAKRKVYI